MTEIRNIPHATYRLQFHKEFTFRDAAAIVDYLADLGISHVYASPILAARPGSTHGYDIVDHNRLNPELGTQADFDALIARMHARGLGLVLDIVPNHMGVGGKDNAWWLDMLEWGEDSPYAGYFDVDWKTERLGMKGKVLLPVLGDQYGKVLAGGEIKLAFDADEGRFSAWYYSHRLPIDPRVYGRIFAWMATARTESLAELTQAFAQLKRSKPAEAYAEAAALKQRLAKLAASDPKAAQLLGEAAEHFNGNAGDLASWMPLHELLQQQSYRPAYWRVAADEINYRRFFNIDDLAGVRVEQRELFEESHRLIFRMVEDGQVQGLRVDHIDGLNNPREYCDRVQARAGRPGRPAYVVVEKIIAPHERLPADWPIAGTSGYDTLNLINAVFVDPAGEDPLDRFYRRYTGRQASFDEVLYASKKRVMSVDLASEMNVLANELHRLSASSLTTRDFTLRGMRDALEEVLAYFSVYRSYITPDGTSDADRRQIDAAVGQAKKHAPAADNTIYDFLHGVLSGDLARTGGYPPAEVFRVAMKAQQISGPVMAKGMEDTAFYRYFRLFSLNEVGGEPRRFGISLAAFHHVNRERLEQWPLAMLASSTHDTKRGEDARARINLLSELPRTWRHKVLGWSRLNRSRHIEVDGAPAPEPNHEYLFYQALFGAWPLDLRADDAEAMPAFAERMVAFMQKALREGKERSSWTNPDAAYEEAVSRFIHGVLAVSSTNAFPADFAGFVESVARFGAINSLAQTLLKLTIPGVPDIYRGADLWDASLVDPDNRRPVDYAQRRRVLAEIDGAMAADLRAGWRDGREKLFLIQRLLGLRGRQPELFEKGDYQPLTATGRLANHVCAFARKLDGRRLVVVVPRLLAGLGSDSPEWGETALPLTLALEGPYTDLFSGRAFDVAASLPIAGLFDDFPVACLVGTAD